jgi:hypothetical protein
MKQISEEVINEIKKLLLKRNSHIIIRNILDSLEDLKDDVKDN